MTRNQTRLLLCLLNQWHKSRINRCVPSPTPKALRQAPDSRSHSVVQQPSLSLSKSKIQVLSDLQACVVYFLLNAGWQHHILPTRVVTYQARPVRQKRPPRRLGSFVRHRPEATEPPKAIARFLLHQRPSPASPRVGPALARGGTVACRRRGLHLPKVGLGSPRWGLGLPKVGSFRCRKGVAWRGLVIGRHWCRGVGCAFKGARWQPWRVFCISASDVEAPT